MAFAAYSVKSTIRLEHVLRQCFLKYTLRGICKNRLNAPFRGFMKKT
jgi:hypothetical protein